MSNFSTPLKSFSFGKISRNTSVKLDESKESSSSQNSRLDFSAHLLNTSSKSWDKEVKSGQIPDVIDFIRWMNDQDQNSSVVAAGNSTRSLSLVKFSEDGISLPGRRFRHSYVQKLHEIDFASRITSVSLVKNGFFAIGHANGSLCCVQSHNNKLHVQTIIQEKGDSPISSVALSSDFVVSGTEKGQIFIDRPNSAKKKIKLASLESGISALSAHSDSMLLAGTTNGKVVVFDIREHSNTGIFHMDLEKDVRRTSFWANRYTDGIKSVDMQAERLIGAGTVEGMIRFADLRNLDEDQSRLCRIKISNSAINQIRFNKSGNKKFYVCCRDGFVEMDFNPLISTWFDDNASKPLFLCNELYHKIDRKWFREFPNVSSFDICADHVVIASQVGDLAFFS